MNEPNAAPLAALWCRVQQDNQRQILGKLLHDLRNPVHSIRISMELFGRLARRQGDVEKLLERAGAYITPAEAALESLVANCVRLGNYLTVPGAVAVAPLALAGLLAEIALLLKGSTRQPPLACALGPLPDGLAVEADRARLAHLLLHCCLSNATSELALTAGEAGGQHVSIELGHGPTAAGPAGLVPALAAEELRALLASAGGELVARDVRSTRMHFRRALAPHAPG